MVSHTQHYLICVCETQSCKHCHSFTDSYSEVVPIDGPPSFRGQAVKYVYKLTIGCQRVNSPIKLLRVPFRVLVLQGEWTFDRLWLSFYSCSHRETGVERSLLRLQYNIRTTVKPEKYWQKKYCGYKLLLWSLNQACRFSFFSGQQKESDYVTVTRALCFIEST